MTVRPDGRPVRIAMVAARARPEIGGIESHVAEVAERLAAHGLDVEVLATDRSGELPRVEHIAGDGDGYGRGYVVRRYRAFPRTRDWYVSPGLGLALLRRRYDLVHVQGVHTLVPPVALLAALVRRRPAVLTFHTGGSSSAFRERSRGLQWRLLAPLLRRVKVLVGVSRFEADRFDDVLGEPGRVRLVRNGGSLPAPRDPVAVDRSLVVSSGRLERYKGHHRAIDALPELLRTHPDARLLVLGSGPYEAELRALAVRRGVADRVEVRHVPPTDREQMARLLAGAGCVVLLSDYEAHPVAVMEALTLGRPVVVARTSGLTELVDQGWARGVEVDADPAIVARAIADQLRQPVLPDAAELPTWETCVAELAGIYAEVLSS